MGREREKEREEMKVKKCGVKEGMGEMPRQPGN